MGCRLSNSPANRNVSNESTLLNFCGGRNGFDPYGTPFPHRFSRGSPALLLDSGAEVGGKKVTDATVRDLTRAVQSVNAKTKPARKASPEESAATQAARALTAWLRSHKVTGATVSAKRSGKSYRLILDLPLSASAALLAIGK